MATAGLEVEVGPLRELLGTDPCHGAVARGLQCLRLDSRSNHANQRAGVQVSNAEVVEAYLGDEMADVEMAS